MSVTVIVFFFILFGETLGGLPPCYTNGTTWYSDDVDNVLLNIADVYLCQESCAEVECKSFTYYSQDHQHFPRVCVHFHNFTTEAECNNCISGPASCTCSAAFSCDVTSDNIIDVIPSTKTETQCQNICYGTPGCNFYTYFDHQHVMREMCYIFSSCNQIDDTCVGCYSGPPFCSSTTTNTTPPPKTTSPTTTTPSLTTTATTPTTTTTPPTITVTPPTTITTSPMTTSNSLCNDINYQTLDDETRRVSHSGFLRYCDNSDGNMNTSPDWLGPGWYRIMSDGGQKMPEYPPNIASCGTYAPGWLNGQHPGVSDGEVEVEVCFRWGNENCQYSTTAVIVNCGEFYIYKLPTAPTCNLRYCAI